MMAWDHSIYELEEHCDLQLTHEETETQRAQTTRPRSQTPLVLELEQNLWSPGFKLYSSPQATVSCNFQSYVPIHHRTRCVGI